MTKDVDPVLWSSLTNVDVTFKQDLMILIQLDNDFKVVEGGNTGTYRYQRHMSDELAPTPRSLILTTYRLYFHD
jgi:hypothetical protein